MANRRKSKRLSDAISREYAAAMAMLEADFAGVERDYCCAANDFKRQPPLEFDLMSAPRSTSWKSAGGSPRVPRFTGVQAAGSTGTH